VDTLKGHGKDVTSCHWNPVHNVIISGSEDETIRIWDATKKEELYILY
jgi:WD40 repeat protein